MVFDVAVIGAGPSGISAALSSARQGMTTVLCTDRPVLGGNSSSEVRVWTRGATGGGNLFAEEMGTLGELKLRHLAMHPDGNVLGWDDVLLDAVLSEKNLTLYLNLPITEVCMERDRQIRSIAGFQSGSGCRVEIRAKMYIDCTGDGEVAFRAGVPFRMGREGRDVYGEDMACAVSDQELLGCSILWQTKRMPYPIPYTPPSYAYTMEDVEGLIQNGGRIVNENMQGSDCWWFEFGGCLDTVRDTQKIHLELRRIVMGIWNYIKNSGRFNADNLQLEWIGAFPGKRESRRFEGMYTLIQQDLQKNRFSGRSVAYGGWFMDTHPAAGIFSSEENCLQPAVNCYGIPLDCFCHPDFPNLMFAGRAASISHQAFTSYRIMNTCALSGDACGMAASLCVREGKTPSQLCAEAERMASIMALEDAVFDSIPDADALMSASSKVSSAHAHRAKPNGRLLALKDDVSIVLPVQGEQASILFNAAADCRVRYRIESQPLPSRLLQSKPLACGEWQLNAGLNRIDVVLPPSDGFSVIRLEDQPDASLCLGEWLCGVCAATQKDPQVYAPAVEWAGAYESAEVLGGYTRPYKKANGWMADASAARLEIDLPEETDISQIRLYFDPDFTSELTSSRCTTWMESHHFCARAGMPVHLVRSYALYADGEKIAEVKDNLSRMPIHRFEARKVKKLVLDIQDTYGGCAVVYRVWAH